MDLGYVELQHTADWAACIWAPDFPGLLIQAARAMFEMSGIRLVKAPKVERDFELEATDDESLLVAFLSELLFLQETEALAFDEMSIHARGLKLQAHLTGGKIESQAKEIKAVTYHNLQILRLRARLEVTIVFDV
ncbi:MAG: archease [Anaerolineaceae bacterium]|nr:archease [Anaerolineaceae bacterium]